MIEVRLGRIKIPGGGRKIEVYWRRCFVGGVLGEKGGVLGEKAGVVGEVF